jgi:hypothetical protein
LIIAIGYETDWNNRIYTHHDGIYIPMVGSAEAKLSLSRKPKEPAMDSKRNILSTRACAALFPHGRNSITGLPYGPLPVEYP